MFSIVSPIRLRRAQDFCKAGKLHRLARQCSVFNYGAQYGPCDPSMRFRNATFHDVCELNYG